MDRRRLLLLILMPILAVLIFFQLKKMGTPEAPPPAPPKQVTEVIEKVQYTDILVASTDISFGTRLNESHMSWRPWPAEAVQGNHITKDAQPQAMEDLTGAVTRTEFFAEDPISERKVVMPGEKSVMAAILNPGMRAVTTRISVDTAAGGFIQPGDHVDIILTTSVSSLQGASTNTKRYVAQTIFENVRVLAIDQRFSNDGEAGASVIGSTATFEMTQEDSELLQQSVAQGDLSLTLRPMGRGTAPGKSHASVKRSNAGEVSSLVIYRDGQPTQVAIRGQ